ncbi:MAG: DNA-3-methyladenine glycosylase 2 family protein [Thermococci archaeon]|nr:DNA-3-methyladenine glycosylase 2 family protein [Thermococci archaeon]
MNMIRNGTWKLEGDTFHQATEDGVIRFSPDGFDPDTKPVRRLLTFILGLDTDLDSFYSEISDSEFSFLSDELRGLAQPAAPSPYQALVEVIAQQQVSFDFAQRAIRNLVHLAGKPAGDLYVFPGAEKLAGMSEADLREAKLGYRAGYIKHLTELYVRGNLRLELWDWDVEQAVKYLMGFRGIGRWTAELFLAYGLRKNTYPAGDLGLRRGVAKILGRRIRDVKERDVREVIDPYGRWSSLLAYYIVCYDRKTEMMKKKVGK